MIKILVADSVVEFCTAAAEAFEDRYEVYVCHDGRTALRLISAERPEVIWLDLMLPGMDGLAILQAVKLAGMSPSIVACVRHVSDHLLEIISRYKICWVMEKPCNLPSALLRIESLAAAEAAKKAESAQSADRMIYETLQILGLTGKKRGHRSLFSALRLMVTDPQPQVTKTLYPYVAAECDGTAQSVERGIRCTITAAWEKRDPLLWELYFPEYVDRCPSNGVFIERVSERIRTALGMNDE